MHIRFACLVLPCAALRLDNAPGDTDPIPPVFWGYKASRADMKQLKGGSDTPIFFEPSSKPYLLGEPEREYYGQWWQDKILAPILNQVEHGFFVESGARNGETDSNTLHYEKHGWAGLLIEPSGTEFPRMFNKQRKAYLYNGCLSPTWKEEALNFGDSGNGLSQITSNGNMIVEAQPLVELLRRANRTTIDFWSLDIEGSEGVVLEHTDFAQLEIGVMLIEMNKGGKNTDVIFSVMRRHGFLDVGTTKYDGGWLDHIFVNPQYFEKRGLRYPRKLLWNFFWGYFNWSASWDWGDDEPPQKID